MGRKKLKNTVIWPKNPLSSWLRDFPHVRSRESIFLLPCWRALLSPLWTVSRKRLSRLILTWEACDMPWPRRCQCWVTLYRSFLPLRYTSFIICFSPIELNGPIKVLSISGLACESGAPQDKCRVPREVSRPINGFKMKNESAGPTFKRQFWRRESNLGALS